MGDLVQFVDSISATPTVRLDVSDATAGWAVRRFMAPPPRLRRAVASNAMRDGINVSTSSYDGRTLTLELECIKADQDAAAAELQKLARELDRPRNFIKYQPNGLTKPVFFVVYRSDMSDLLDVIAQKAMRQFTVELMAEPFAVGLKETLGPFTVNNDPAAGSNGHYVDVTGVIGDVPTPCVIRDTGSHALGGYIAVRQHGTPSSGIAPYQAESSLGGTDTTNPGGGPDAAMSGLGTNNFIRTDFSAGTAMTARWNGIINGTANTDGTYRVVGVVRRSDATSVIKARLSVNARGAAVTGSTVTVPASTSRQLIDFGIFSFGVPSTEGGYGAALTTRTTTFAVEAERSSGAGTIDWDYLLFLPADESLLIYRRLSNAGLPSGDLVHDTFNEAVTYRDNVSASSVRDDQFGVSGGFPLLVPSQANRVWYVMADLYATPYAITKTQTAPLTFEYYPRYLYARPVAS